MEVMGTISAGGFSGRIFVRGDRASPGAAAAGPVR
jgi:hypothetical protein